MCHSRIIELMIMAEVCHDQELFDPLVQSDNASGHSANTASNEVSRGEFNFDTRLIMNR